MTKVFGILTALTLLWLLPIAGCDCGGGRNVTPDRPLLGQYSLSSSETVGEYHPMPEGPNPDEGLIGVDFAVIAIKTTSSQYLFIKNTGTGKVQVVGVEWEGAAPATYALSCLEQTGFAPCQYSTQNYLEIEPGSPLVVRISYSPQEVGEHAGTFVIRSNAQDYPTVRVNVHGKGSRPAIEVCIKDCVGDESSAGCAAAAEICSTDHADITVQYGDLDTGKTAAREVVVKNNGEMELVVSAVKPEGGDFTQFEVVEKGGLPGSVAAGSEVRLRVRYQPVYGGDHTSSLLLLTNDMNVSGGRFLLPLHGRGLAPRVCPEPMSLDFGNVPVGSNRSLSFTIRNCGLKDLEVQRLDPAVGSSPDFSIDRAALPALPRTLGPEEALSVPVVYQPRERGSDTGAVEIYSNDPMSDPNSHLTGAIALRGNGLVRECDIQVTPWAVNFGGVVQNTEDTVQLVISNVGSDVCSFRSASITQNSADNEFGIAQAPPDNTDFNPGEILSLTLKYAPKGLGADNGVLTIVGTDKDGANIPVNLSGEGVQSAVCDAKVTPSSMNFGTVKLNQSKSLVVTIQNVGNAVCNFGAPNLSHAVMPGYASDFSVTRGPGGPFTVMKKGQPGDRVEIEVTFAPLSVNMHGATLTFHTNDDPDVLAGGGAGFCFMPGGRPPAAGDACILITGQSAESDIEVVPAELDFGVVTLGCNSPEMKITVYNLGTIALNIQDIYLERQDGNFEIRQAPRLPYQLSGGSHFEVKLRYHPQDTNAHRNTLYIQSDASNVDLLAVPLYGRGTLISDQTDVFHQPSQVKSDVLFVIDNSGSMSWAQGQLASHFSNFISWAVSQDVDYHIGVIATEVNDPERNRGTPPRDIIPGVLVQAPGRPKIITNQTPDINNAFKDNALIGDCCSDEQEAGLQAAWMALSPPLVDDPASNAGFLRDDAKLYIICIADEQDQSKGEVDFYVDFFQNIKGPRNTEMMKVSAIVQDSSLACNPNGSAGTRYVEVARRTGGINESVCGNWPQTLQNLGIQAFTPIREFPLSRPADPNTITVTVNGVSVPKATTQGGANGWSYYGDTNSVFFGDNVVPQKGDRIEIHYTAACL